MEHLFDKGVTVKKFAGFVTPSVIMFIFIALYYIIDSVFVANFVNSDALAALNIVYPIVGIGTGVGVMLAAGSSAIIAIKMGEGKQREANENFSLICIVSLVFGVLVVLAGLSFLKELIGLLGATERLWVYCMDYTWIIIIALPAVFLGVLFEYFIRVDGKPGFTLFLYVIGGIVHIVLDFIFLVLWDWGIAGAGWATAIGQATVAVLGFVYFVTQKTNLAFTKPKWDAHCIGHSIVNGSSEMVSESSVAITVYVLNTIVLRLIGENGVAALSIVLNAQYLLISLQLGFITGVSPLISYYYGAKEYDKVNVFIKYSKIFVLASSVGMALLALVEAPLLARVFVDTDTEIYYVAIRGIRFLSVAFLFTGVNIFASGFFTSYGNGIISAMISLSSGLIMIIIGAVTLPRLFGLDGVWMTVGFAEITTFALSIFLFSKYKNVYHYKI